MMLAGVRPTIRLASAPMASTRFDLRVDRDDRRLVMTIPRSRTLTSVFAVPEVDADVMGEEAEQAVEHDLVRVLPEGIGARRAAGGAVSARGFGRKADAVYPVT